MDIEKIKQNLESIRQELGTNVTLVAVTKTVGVEEIKFLKSLGVTDFGENRLNVAEPKIKEVKAAWHMIGHLQSNKVRKAVEIFDMIQSVDSLSLAEKINFECEKQKKIMPILIQVNVAKEAQKSGFEVSDVEKSLMYISQLRNIKIKGFMMIAPNIESEDARIYFKRMKELFDKYKEKYDLTTLSMGMSNDYRGAIEEESNMVRIGTKLFE